MATTRITDKLSKIVNWQLPEHIRSDYPTFVAFLEYYYQYIEQDQYAQELIQNARSYADIDRTAATFVQYFLKNYAKDIPSSILANKPLLIKRISDLYEAKGSALSFKLLFNILYQSDVEVKYPYENVLRASDGIWQQLTSIKVITSSGDRTKIADHILYFEKNNRTYTIPVVKVINLTPTITEVYLDTNSTAVINNLFEGGDEVYVLEGTTEVFRGTVGYTTTGTNILNGGLNFKTGQIFKINYAGAINTLVQVTNVTSQGSITELKFINYGHGFTSNATVNLRPTSVAGAVTDEYNTTSNGFTESGVVYVDSDYFAEHYVLGNTYVMAVGTTFTTDGTVEGGTIAGALDNTVATVTFIIGTIGRYPGNFITNRGFISDNEIRLQNNLLYQPFAYQINSDVELSKFEDTVKKTIHPAGQELYNNRLLENSVNVQANVTVINTSNISIELQDTLVVVGDEITIT